MKYQGLNNNNNNNSTSNSNNPHHHNNNNNTTNVISAKTPLVVVFAEWETANIYLSNRCSTGMLDYFCSVLFIFNYVLITFCDWYGDAVESIYKKRAQKRNKE